MTVRRRMIAVAGIATVTLAGAGLAAGVALADPSPTSNPTPTVSPSAGSAQGKHKGHHGLLGKRVLHGEFVAAGKSGFTTIDTQRGSVTAVSPTSVSLRSADGFTATYAVGADVRVRKDGAKATIGAVKVGDPAVVVATKQGSAITVRGLVVRAPKAKPAN